MQADLKSTKKIAAKRGAKKKIVRIAKVTKTFDAAGNLTIKVKLSKTGKALLKALKKIPLKATLTVVNSAGKSATASGKLTIKR